MATIPDSLMATIVAQWTGAGGTIPSGQFVSEDFTSTNLPPTGGNEYIWIDSLFKTTLDAVNDIFENRTHVVYIKVNTGTDADRRKEVANEVVRILSATTITGVNRQRVTDRDRILPKLLLGQQAEMVEVTLEEFMVSGATAYGPGATGDFDVGGDLTVAGDADITGDLEIGGELIMDAAVMLGTGSDFHMHPATGNVPMNLLLHPLGTEDESALKLRTSTSANYGEFKVKVDGTTASIESNQGGSGTTPDTLDIDDAGWDTINIGDSSAAVTVAGGKNISEALMLGSANAAWQPCMFAGKGSTVSIQSSTDHRYQSGGVGAKNVGFYIPLPTNKGSLKLYVDDLRFSAVVADGANYVDTITIYGITDAGGATSIEAWTTNHTSSGLKTWTRTPSDMSTYRFVLIHVATVNTGTTQRFTIPDVLCYYDT